MQSIILC